MGLRAFLIALVSLVLAGCYRPVPAPGSVYIQKGYSIPAAPGYLVGKTGFFRITEGTGPFKAVKGDKLVLVFLLGNRYELYQQTHGTRLLFSAGSYVYSLDTFKLDRSMLNLIGRNGSDFTLFYTGHSAGHFVANSNQPKVIGHMKGSFTFKEIPTKQSLRY
jgi:hypothetical protein